MGGKGVGIGVREFGNSLEKKEKFVKGVGTVTDRNTFKSCPF